MSGNITSLRATCLVREENKNCHLFPLSAGRAPSWLVIPWH